ncbi:MAG: treZ-2 [Chthoniobacteraceae bacterium]|nr:treZ-2 [Chthoniobacteraceae bacterium]
MNLKLPPQRAVPTPHGVNYRISAPLSRTIELEVFDESGQKRRSVSLLNDTFGFFYGLDIHGRAGNLSKFRLDDGQSLPDPAPRWLPIGRTGQSLRSTRRCGEPQYAAAMSVMTTSHRVGNSGLLHDIRHSFSSFDAILI